MQEHVTPGNGTRPHALAWNGGATGTASPAGRQRPLHLLLVAPSGPRGVRTRRALAAAGPPRLEWEECSSLLEAHRHLSRGGIELVLLDLDTEAGSGLRALGRLQAVTPEVPVVVLADAQQERLAAQAVRQGAQDYLLCEPDLDRVLARTAWCAVERHRRWVQLRDLSLTDPLTGLYNRRGFRALAEAHLRTLRRTRRQSLLVCADLDGLKEINDHHGHPAGDRALIEVARLMRRCFRESDILARYGGDEFVALAQDATRNASRKLVLRVERGLDELNASARLPYNLALSVGTVVFGGRSSQSLATLMALADRALYREKQRGGRRPPARREVLARCA